MSVLYRRYHFEEALKEGGVRLELAHKKLVPKIENLEVQSWWCNDCGLQVEAPDG